MTPFSDADSGCFSSSNRKATSRFEVILAPFDQMFQKTILAGSRTDGRDTIYRNLKADAPG